MLFRSQKDPSDEWVIVEDKAYTIKKFDREAFGETTRVCSNEHAGRSMEMVSRSEIASGIGASSCLGVLGQLPWAGKLGGDDRFKGIEGEKLRDDAEFTLVQMDDLAVLVLFSVSKAQVRNRLATELRTEVGEKSLSHPVLFQAVEDLIQQVEEGSFFKGLGPYKSLDADLVEEVNQVRRYRNWVAHGRRGKKPPGVDPKTAYERLNRF